MRTAGIILAGGRSTRMGGDEKSLLTLGGKPLLRHVLDRLKPQVTTVVLNANGDPSRFAAFGLPVVADKTNDWPGPLAGILAGMEWAAGQNIPHILTVPADTPFIPGDLAAKLSAASVKAGAIAIVASEGARHPVVALWPVSLKSALAQFLAHDGNRKVTSFADRHGAVSIDFPKLALNAAADPFFNVNTPDDLAQAEAILKAMPA
ncbi:MAG TPA: molybdenum cofactor guanylyltransferase MobA [Rhizobiaceae bacterium]|nr:molybdenum cofactor guanylyltransferase MobA [Rhizobiaceae bacterium]